MSNKYTNEVEIKGLVKNSEDYWSIQHDLAMMARVSKVLNFDNQVDLFWDVGSPTTEAFIRERRDTLGSDYGWLIKIQQDSFNNRIEIDLPIRNMVRPYDYKITKSGSVWKHEIFNCEISLYYVYELEQHFIEIESIDRCLRDVNLCRTLLDIPQDIEYVQTSLFSLVKKKSITKG